MRRLTMLSALLLLGCDQLGEPGNESPVCATSEDCGDGLVCLDTDCVAPSSEDLPNPALEREADDLGKLGVERDMLESKVAITNEALEDAIEVLKDAKTDEEKRSAAKNKSKAAAAHMSAKTALNLFAKRHSRAEPTLP
tara:strand:+ start:148150 stop:148566 length:417 start_codon:yes stop_codon:yes gene_type:complete